MKTTFLLLVILVSSLRAFSQSTSLSIVIKNIKDDHGFISAALYNSGEEFMKKIYQSRKIAAAPGEVQLVFDGLPPGEYAVSVMHDANKNGKLDSNMVGIPKEGFGFSNDALGTFGPPDYDKAKFSISADQSISITLKYY